MSQIKDDELEGVLADYIFQNLNKFYELEDFDINEPLDLSGTIKIVRSNGDDDYRIEYFRINIVEKKVVNKIKQVLEQVPA